tara:strand:- start:12295 stop:13611 length:1317 start_codon:yes stop_codon:yes gene_type:complete
LNLFEISLKLNQFPLKKAKSFYDKINKLNYGEFLNYQNDSKLNIFNYHFKKNNFYRDFLRQKNFKKLNKWEDIPIIKKKNFQLPINKMLSSDYNINNIHVHNTSGSSGIPFYFAKDRFSHALSWVNNINLYKSHDIDYGKSLQARFYGIPLDFHKNLKERFKDFLSSRIRLNIFDLSEKSLSKYLKIFERNRIEYLNGYTSSILLFAKYLVKNKIILKDICKTLKVCIPTSEILFDLDREIMQRAFGVPVINEYGAAELEIIAMEDKKSNFIINDSNLFVEVVNEEGKILKYGSEGRIIITSLHNKAMPFIRYEIGDIGIIKNLKNSNKKVISKLQGRINDNILLPSGKISPGLAFYYISKAILEKGGFFKEFIIKQKTKQKFIIEYVSDFEINSNDRNKIYIAMDKYLEPGLEIKFFKKKKIDRTQHGKLRHFQRLF